MEDRRKRRKNGKEMYLNDGTLYMCNFMNRSFLFVDVNGPKRNEISRPK